MVLRPPSHQASLRTTVCVVGSGPAGITCAMELARRGIAVMLVESGGETFQDEAQAMCDAELADARRHATMQDAVRRAFGGTSWLWGGRCIPFDPIDFEPRDYAPGTAWPIRYEELSPYYARACEYTNCGQPAFTLDRLAAESASRPITARFQPGDVIASDLERWSGEPNFARRYRDWFEREPSVQLLLGATCVDIEPSADREHVASIVVARGAARTRIVADHFVLACGGLEATRLLLNVNARHGDRLGNRSGLLGRHYMGHISGKIASVRFDSEAARTIYHFERDAQGFYARRRFTVPARVQREQQLLNTAMWLDNHPPADPAHGNGILSFAYLALCTPVISRYLAPPAIAKLVANASARKDRGAHVRNVCKDLAKIATFVPPFVYRRYFARPRLPGFFLPSPNNVYALHYHAEQLPSRESRVTLADTADCHGMRRLRIDLRYQHADADSVVRCHALLDRHLRKTGAGRLEYWMPEAERVDAVLAQAADGFHQIGTARMAAHWRDGVVDPRCRVFGTDNLYVASSAVFPSSGQANPTLTIVALSARIADDIAAQLARPNASDAASDTANDTENRNDARMPNDMPTDATPVADRNPPSVEPIDEPVAVATAGAPR